MSKRSPLTWSQATDLFGVSRGTLSYARKVTRSGTPALVAALGSGLISVLGAYWLTTHADAFGQNWVVAKRNRAEIRRRLRMVRRGDSPISQTEADAIPRPAVVPQIRSVAVAAARAALRTRTATPRKSRIAKLIERRFVQEEAPQSRQSILIE